MISKMLVDYNIILCGFMGSGKTTVGKLLATKLSLNFVDTDKYIENMTHLTVSEIFDRYGENYFRKLENDISKKAECFIPSVLALGGGTLEKPENVHNFKTTGKIVFLNASLDSIRKRLENDNSRPLIRGRYSLESLYYSRIKTYEKVADVTVQADGLPDIVCQEILNTLLVNKKELHK